MKRPNHSHIARAYSNLLLAGFFLAGLGAVTNTQLLWAAGLAISAAVVLSALVFWLKFGR